MRIATALLLLLPAGAGPEAAPKPNIVIIMADDMGFSDIGCYGGEIETPNLDRLAAGGLRFTQFYNTGRCCPSRASLLTGLYSHQAGIGHMTGNRGIPSYQGYLNDRCRTIAEVLRPAGYTTLMSGKWHVGSRPGHWPRDRGFDRYYGPPSGGGVYFKDNLATRKEFFLVEGADRLEMPDDWYVTDAFTDRAVRYIEEASKEEKPFFLYLAHIAPHWPLQAKKKDIDTYRGRYRIGWDEVRTRRHRRQVEMGIVRESWGIADRDATAWAGESEEVRADQALRMAVYAAQIDCIDQNVGKVVDALERTGRFDDTLILFLSDNGGSAEGGPHGFSRGIKGRAIDEPGSYASYGRSWANASNTPFRRYKSWVHEGGIATPLVAHWPKGLSRKGELERQPGHVIDLLPTCAELAGAEVDVEGKSLLPAFRGETIRRDALFWEHQGNRAVRVGKWKLVSRHPEDWELYDLEADRTERHDLASKHPDRVKELAGTYAAWAERAGVMPWPVKRRKPK